MISSQFAKTHCVIGHVNEPCCKEIRQKVPNFRRKMFRRFQVTKCLSRLKKDFKKLGVVSYSALIDFKVQKAQHIFAILGQ